MIMYIYISILFNTVHIKCDHLYSTYSSIIKTFHSQSMMIKELVLVHFLYYISNHMLYLAKEHSC